jgi:hypothetical protein
MMIDTALRTTVMLGMPGHPVFNTAYYGYRYLCGCAFNVLTFTASTS